MKEPNLEATGAGGAMPWAWISGSFVLGLLVGMLGMSLAGGGGNDGTRAGGALANAESGALPGQAREALDPSAVSPIGGGATNMDGATNPEAALTPAGGAGSPEAVMEKLLTTLESGEDIDGLSVLARIQQLKDLGDAGIQVISDYLASYQDIEFGDDMGRLSRRFPNLRAMLIDSLEDVNSPLAQQANLQVVQTSPYLSEIAMAANNLEETWPGEHRDAALKAMSDLLTDYNQRIAEDPEAMDDFSQQREYYLAMRFISDADAAELLPQMERAVALSGEGAGHFVMQLGDMSQESQRDSLNRLVSQENTRKQIAESGWALSRLDMSDPGVAQTSLGLFTSDMNAEQQKNLIEGLGRAGDNRRRWGPSNDMSPEQQQARISGATQFINTLTTTPGALQNDSVAKAAQDALNQLNRRAQNSAEG